MKAVILAGGRGSRLGERTSFTPKPLLEVAGKPIILHIMDHLSTFGISEFIVLGGYKVSTIKEFFLNLNIYTNDIQINFNEESVETIGSRNNRNWTVEILDTGMDTMTGGRLLRARDRLISEERFLLTYGDGIADINVSNLIKFHLAELTIATLTAVNPPPRFGNIEVHGNIITEFHEKSSREKNLVNGGFFILERKIFEYLTDDFTIFESGPLKKLSQENQLKAFVHPGFWQCIDTERDLEQTENFFKGQSNE